MELGNRQQETVFNIVTMLTGKAWDLVEDFSMEQLAATNAFAAVFARLDSGFRYDPLTELPDDFETFFVKLHRRGGQTLQDYMTDLKAERRLKISHNVELPEKVTAWWFLRRSGITKEQRQMILTNVGVTGLEMDQVMKAMSFILGQDSRADGSQRSYKRYKTEAYYQEDDLEWYPDPMDRQMPVYYENEEDVGEEPWMDDGQDYYAAEDAVHFSMDPIYDVDEYDGVFTTYQDAKAKLNALRTSRGFYPVVVSLDASATGAKGAESRPKTSGGKKGKGKNKGKNSGKGKAANPKGRASAAGYGGGGKTLCLRCGQPGHWARNCPLAGSLTRSARSTQERTSTWWRRPTCWTTTTATMTVMTRLSRMEEPPQSLGAPSNCGATFASLLSMASTSTPSRSSDVSRRSAMTTVRRRQQSCACFFLCSLVVAELMC